MHFLYYMRVTMSGGIYPWCVQTWTVTQSGASCLVQKFPVESKMFSTILASQCIQVAMEGTVRTLDKHHA